MEDLDIVNERDSEINRKLKEFLTSLRTARLVGCVRGSMVIGYAQCPLIALCEYAPTKDIQETIRDITGYDAIFGQDSREISLKFIDDAWKLLGEAKEITAICPLRIITKMPHPYKNG